MIFSLSLCLCASVVNASAQTVNCGQTGQRWLDWNDAGYAAATPCVTGSNAGGYTVSSVYYWVGNPVSTSFVLGLYSNSSNLPQNLLCSAATGTITPSSGWNSIAITGCGLIPPNTTLWIGYLTQSNTIQQGWVSGACPGTSIWSAWDNGGDATLPNPYSGSSAAPNCYSLYAVLSASSGAAAYIATMAETNTAADSLARHATYWRGDAISVSWTPPAGASGNSAYAYNVYRGTASGNETGPINPSPVDAGCVAKADCGYVDYGPQAGTTYYYEMTTVHSGSESAVSNESGTVIATDAMLEAGGASDALAGSHGQTITLAETHTASDLLAAAFNSHQQWFAALSESLSPATDSLARHSAAQRAMAETHTASDVLARAAAHFAALADTYSAGDSLAAFSTVQHSWSATLAELLSPASDALARQSVTHRGMAETHSAIDGLARAAAHFARLTETHPAGDGLSIACNGRCRQTPRPVRPRHREF